MLPPIRLFMALSVTCRVSWCNYKMVILNNYIKRTTDYNFLDCRNPLLG
jgi:hypothetical protein